MRDRDGCAPGPGALLGPRLPWHRHIPEAGTSTPLRVGRPDLRSYAIPAPRGAERGAAGLDEAIRSGAVTNSGGKVGGEIRFTRAGIALVNIKTEKAVKLTGFVDDLSQGKLSAVLDRGPRVTLGTFPRPRAASAIDTEAAALHANTAITVTAAAAARLNAALGTTCFTGGGSLLHIRIDAALAPSIDLGTALNLGSGRGTEAG